jgi:hypothetical protein
MNIYRVSHTDKHAGHQGYEYFGNRAAAHRKAAELRTGGRSVEVDGPHSIPLTKAGVVAALNRFGCHPDNG